MQQSSIIMYQSGTYRPSLDWMWITDVLCCEAWFTEVVWTSRTKSSYRWLSVHALAETLQGWFIRRTEWMGLSCGVECDIIKLLLLLLLMMMMMMCFACVVASDHVAPLHEVCIFRSLLLQFCKLYLACDVMSALQSRHPFAHHSENCKNFKIIIEDITFHTYDESCWGMQRMNWVEKTVDEYEMQVTHKNLET